MVQSGLLPAGGDAGCRLRWILGVPNENKRPNIFGSTARRNAQQHAIGNFYREDSTANGYNDGYAVTGSTSYSSSQNYLTDVGAYTSSPSYYGTFDQGGNVYEWNETATSSSTRGFRGGSWNTGLSDDLNASEYFAFVPTDEDYGVGFRVASIPEPSAAALIGLAAVALFNTRRRRA